jgi:hypothetical protein
MIGLEAAPPIHRGQARRPMFHSQRLLPSFIVHLSSSSRILSPIQFSCCYLFVHISLNTAREMT